LQNNVKRYAPMVCLFLTALSYLLYQFCRIRYSLVMEHYTCLLLFFYLGITIIRDGFRARIDFCIGLLWMSWYVISRILLKELYLENSYCDFGSIFVAVCFALPFASYGENHRKTGLKTVSILFAIVISATAWLSIFGVVLRTQIRLPVLGSYFGKDQMEARLNANLNPNLSAAMFLAAVLLAVWYLLENGRRWMTIPAVGVLSGLYIGIALTVSRTVMIQLSVSIALLTLFACLRFLKNQYRRYVFVSVAASIGAFAITYFGFDAVRNGFNHIVISTALAENIKKRPLLNDLLTLTERTQIYADTCKGIIREPKILLLGTTLSELADFLRLNINGFYHAHNAYLQVLLIMGIPGVAAAIWFTVRAIYVGWKLLIRYYRYTTLSQKWMAISVWMMLLSAIPEPYLFTAHLPAYHFVFFLLLGYMLKEERRIRDTIIVV